MRRVAEDGAEQEMKLTVLKCVGYGKRTPWLWCRAGLRALVWMMSASAATACAWGQTPAPSQANQNETVATAPASPNSSTAKGGDPAQAKGDIFASVIANQKRTEAALGVYERTQRVEYRHSSSDPKPANVKTFRLFPAGTGMDKILVSEDGRPISDETYRLELEKLEKMLEWAAQSGAAQQEAYAKAEKKQKERMDLIESTHNAFVFTRIGEEMRGERKLITYSMMPNPKYKPATRNEIVFTRVQGTVWIDEQSKELARIEGRVTEDISLALFLAKVNKGSTFMQERYELFPGVWLPTFEQFDFDGRKFWLSFAIHEKTFYSNYRHVGPPKDAVEVVRSELSKPKEEKADP